MTRLELAFDANIWISFTIGKHLAVLSQILLDDKIGQQVGVHSCPQILVEYQRVVQRPKLTKYIRPERVQETLDLMARVTEEHWLTNTVTGARDANDDYLLALSEAVPLDYLVTGDRDLLVLGHWQRTYIINFATFEQLIRALPSDVPPGPGALS